MSDPATPAETRPDEVHLSSTEVQSRFGGVLRRIREGSRVVVRRRGRPEAVLVPIDEYREFERRALRPLPELEKRLDAVVERMREEGAHDALDRALASGPEALAARVAAGGR